METPNSHSLSNYERDGFAVIPDFVPADICDVLRGRALDLVASFHPKGSISIFSTKEQTRKSDDYFLESGDKISFFFEEDSVDAEGRLLQPKERSINKIGHALHDLDPIFNQFSRRPEVAELAKSLGFERPLLLQSMYIFKQPGIGGEVTCHQDSAFLYSEPRAVVGLWFALEDATVDNGALWVIPGGHRLGLKSRFVRAPEGGTMFEVYDATPWPTVDLIPIEATKGTLVILHGLLPHMSHANRSPISRHAYTLHIIEGGGSYPANNWLQRRPDMPLRGFENA